MIALKHTITDIEFNYIRERILKINIFLPVLGYK